MTSFFPRNPWLLLALRWIVGAVFLYAGAVKVGHPQDFADSIASFELLPDALVNGFALCLPPFEILTALLLWTGWQLRASTLAVLGMTGIFAAALLLALARGLHVDCGCLGAGKPSVLKTWLSLGRDVCLFAAAFLVRRGRGDRP